MMRRRELEPDRASLGQRSQTALIPKSVALLPDPDPDLPGSRSDYNPRNGSGYRSIDSYVYFSLSFSSNMQDIRISAAHFPNKLVLQITNREDRYTMERSPSSLEIPATLKKGPWAPEEDEKLKEFIGKNGIPSWRALPQQVGLNRGGKSCRLRWMNYPRPEIKQGNFSEDEERPSTSTTPSWETNLICRWSKIANQLHGRTDNSIKNLWNTHSKRKLLHKGRQPTSSFQQIIFQLPMISSRA
ncbi:hypothetical protein SAY86_019594 [Trapa natans]|uniref:Uncharacterized protein n=1 Tax=Trapa natans TaxID=22666 RepID=A0AAN7LYY9_TRANT|nr:hypothetical protein SAY86_019594 [Trapa natans]